MINIHNIQINRHLNWLSVFSCLRFISWLLYFTMLLNKPYETEGHELIIIILIIIIDYFAKIYVYIYIFIWKQVHALLLMVDY